MKINTLIKLTALMYLLFLHQPALAQINFSVDKTGADGLPNEPEIRPLNWLNETFLEKQRDAIDALTRVHLGRKLNGNKADFRTLQRVIDEELVPKDDKEMLQAMGVILGDIYVKEHKDLRWMVYSDELGPSHAVCLDDTDYCLFPITMLSRRMELGVKPKVTAVYRKGYSAIEAHLPKLPFSD